MNQTTRYFAYVRKSTDDPLRQQRSIGDQIEELKMLAEREGIQIVEIIEEKQSAKIPGRPKFNEMLVRIERGEASAIIAWHPDRIARNPIDSGRVIHLLDTGKITDLKFSTYRFEANAQGKFMLAVMFGQSKYYVDNLSENIRRGMSHKLKEGGWPQAAPIGYMNDAEARTIVPHPVNGPIMRQMFELYATGDYPVTELREVLIDMGLTLGLRGRNIAAGKVYHALRNPFYYGVMRYGGEYYDGKHKPLVTQELFEKCQQMMKRRGRAGRRGKKLKVFAYRRLFRCGECGCMISMEVQKGHQYLRCTRKRRNCRQKFIRGEEMTRQLNADLHRFAMHPRTAGRLLAKIEGIREEESQASLVEQAKLKQEIVACQDRQDQLMNLSLDRLITVDEFRKTKNRLVLDEKAARERLAALAAGSWAIWLEPFKRFVNASLEATSVAESEDEAVKAKFVRTLGSNPTLRDQRLKWDLRGVWQLVENPDFVALKSLAAKGEFLNESEREEENEREWSGGESNSRPRHCERRALPTELPPRSNCAHGAAGAPWGGECSAGSDGCQACGRARSREQRRRGMAILLENEFSNWIGFHQTPGPLDDEQNYVASTLWMGCERDCAVRGVLG